MWYIMSYNYLRGFVSGAFQDVDALFYAGTEDGEHYKWVSLLSDAKSFNTLDEAKYEVKIVYGDTAPLEFGYLNFDSHSPELHKQREDYARAIHDKFNNMSRRLASGQIEGAALIPLAKKTPQDVGLTWRERWIIEILTKNR